MKIKVIFFFVIFKEALQLVEVRENGGLVPSIENLDLCKADYLGDGLGFRFPCCPFRCPLHTFFNLFRLLSMLNI